MWPQTKPNPPSRAAWPGRSGIVPGQGAGRKYVWQFSGSDYIGAYNRRIIPTSYREKEGAVIVILSLSLFFKFERKISLLASSYLI